MDKQNVVNTHTMKNYSALKRKEILTHATTRMNLGGQYVEWNQPVTEGQIL